VASLVDSVVIRNRRRRVCELVLLFHGVIEQWPFFDFEAGREEPPVQVAIKPADRTIAVTQTHLFTGIPEVHSTQRIQVNAPLASYGFGLGVGDLDALIHDYGCLASLRMRLGQVGGRLDAPSDRPVEFAHRHPLYYVGVRIRLKPMSEKRVVVRSEFASDYPGAELPDPLAALSPEKALARIDAEWRRYFERDVPQLSCDDEGLMRFWYYVWYVLRANRTQPGPHVKYPFTSPSKYLYWGPWMWDGYFHTLGEMWLRDKSIARDTIRAVLAMQWPNGYVPVCTGSAFRMCFGEKEPRTRIVQDDVTAYSEGPDADAGTFRCRPRFEGRRRATGVTQERTQTPLIGCAAWEYARLRDDRRFAKEVLPGLVTYENWLWRRRTDRQGRLIGWHPDESGWDNATRHQPIPFKAVDMTAHAAQQRRSLVELAGSLGEGALAEEMGHRVRKTERAIASMWDAKKGCYLDRDGRSRVRPQIAASAFFPMWANLADKGQAARLAKLLHSRDFATAYPVPTLSTRDADYTPHGWGWNGPVWLQVNWFIMEGLFNYGYREEAMKLWGRTKGLLLRNGEPQSFELYDPEAGTGMGCPDYSWQALVNHFVITRLLGFNGYTLSPSLPQDMNHLSVRNLPARGRIWTIGVERRRRSLRVTVENDRPCSLVLRFWKEGKLSSIRVDGRESIRSFADDGAALVRETRMGPRTEVIVR